MKRRQELQASNPEQGCNPILTLGGRVSQATTLAVLVVAGLGSGLILGWDSLVALGLSTFIIAMLPCAAMCALGICASRKGKKDAPDGNAPVPPSEARTPEKPAG